MLVRNGQLRGELAEGTNLSFSLSFALSFGLLVQLSLSLLSLEVIAGLLVVFLFVLLFALQPAACFLELSIRLASTSSPATLATARRAI